MTTGLHIQVLGAPQIVLNGRSLVPLLPHKACALFLYLAVTGQRHSREKLAALLWGGRPDNRARNNLSIALNKLKQCGLGAYLQAGRKFAAFQPGGACICDWVEFEQVAHQFERMDGAQRQAIGQKYRGEFLADFYAGQEADVELFDEWVRTQRAYWQSLALKVFARLAAEMAGQGAYEPALHYVAQQLAILPWHEQAHRQRMSLLARQGHREQALAQYQHCCDLLRQELAVEPAPETTALYEKILTGSQEWRENTAVSVPFQAPALPPYFVGRTQLLSELGDYLTGSRAACLALVGMGGIGKSTLAARLAHQLRHHFCDGVLWAYADTQDLMTMIEQWGQAFGLDWSQITELENRAAAFRNLLADKKVLIVLDDLSQAAAVRLLMPNTPDCALLITSRDQDVAYALHARVEVLSVFAQEESRALLQAIVGEARVAGEAAAVAQICALLEHLPLAVEIVAQRLRSRPRWQPSRLAAELAQVKSRLEKLQLKDRAVRASFELSWQLLDEGEQTCFAHLAVFAGRHFDDAAAAAVIEAEQGQVLHQLEALAALSLLMPIADTHYRQHALLADFAYEKLNQTPTHYQAARRRMVAYYYQFTQRHQTDYASLRPEWPNLNAAVQTAYDQQTWPLVVAFTHLLTPVWFTRARYHEARAIYPLAHQAAVQMQDRQTAACMQLEWAKACIEQDDFGTGRAKLMAALAQFRQTADEGRTADAMLELGRVAIENGEYEAAHQWLMDGQELAAQLQDEAQLAVAAYRLARLYYRSGEYETAESHCLSVLAWQEKCDYRLVIRTYRLLATLCVDNHAFVQAQTYCQTALKLAYQYDNKDEVATTLNKELSIVVRLKDHEKARRIATECLELFRQMGAEKLYALTLYEWSISFWYQKKWLETHQLLEEAIPILEALADHFNLVKLLLLQANTYHSSGDQKKACQIWQTALSLAIPERHTLTGRIQKALQHHCDGLQ